jgi:geranyl-CoA carboxylase alpha subunit
LNPSQAISPYYDPMLAKIIAVGASRAEARRRLVQALEQTVALGTGTNRTFLIDALSHPEFAAGKATTQFVPKHFAKVPAPAADAAALGVAAVLWFEASARQLSHDPARAWSSSGALSWPLRLQADGKAVACAVTVLGPRRYRVEIDADAIEISLVNDCDGRVRLAIGGLEHSVDTAFAGDTLHLKYGALDLAVRETLYEPPSGAGAAGGTDTQVRAPMNGKVVSVLIREGDAVARGQHLVIVEAMKMQHEMVAGANGTVARLAVKPGDQVATRQLLVELKLTG